GVTMINFYSAFLSQPYLDALKATAPECNHSVQTLKEEAAAQGRPIPWEAIQKLKLSYANRISRPPFSVLIDHIDHVALIAGIDHVGIGSDFDGVGGQLPRGMDSPADLPKITTALLDRGYTPDDCRKILGGNLLRVFREVEELARERHRDYTKG